MITNGQIVADGHPMIKHKTLAPPSRLLRGDHFEIVQDAAAKVIDILEATLFEIRR